MTQFVIVAFTLVIVAFTLVIVGLDPTIYLTTPFHP